MKDFLHLLRRLFAGVKNLPIVLRIEKSIFSIIYYIRSLKHKKRNTSGRNYEVFLKIYFFILGLNINDARYPNINAALIPTALALNPPRNTPMNPS